MRSDPSNSGIPASIGEAEERELVAALARKAVSRAAPEELPLFRATSTAYFADPDRVTEPREGQDDMLGFGVEAALVLVTPAALEAAKAVVRYLATEVATAAKAEAGPRIQLLMRRLFRVGDDAEIEPASAPGPEPAVSDQEEIRLTPEQLGEVREVVTATAQRLKLSEARATILADAIVGTLAV